jgi:hypothetical protein
MRFITTLITILIAATMLVGCANSAPAAGEVRGDNLREIIENQIRDNVRESFGELAGQNFSDVDFDRFTRDKVPEQIVTILQTNSRFLAALDKVRAMSPGDRESYLKRCRLPLRKTWAEQGEISSKGTTDAGRKAELAIAKAIVDLAEKLLASSAKPAPKAAV